MKPERSFKTEEAEAAEAEAEEVAGDKERIGSPEG